MRQIDKDTKEKRNKRYNDWARKKPAYICLVIPVLLGIAMGINDYMETKMLSKAFIYLLSVPTISAALFFLLRFLLRDISKFYPGKILFCDRLKPTTRILYSTDDGACENFRGKKTAA